MRSNSIPSRLYKYRSFNNNTLDLLIRDRLYFSNPASFNDPLDTKPALAVDIEVDALIEVLRELSKERTRLEKSKAAASIKYRGSRTLDHIARLSEDTAEKIIADIRYNASNFELEDGDDPIEAEEDNLCLLLKQHIEDELLLRYDRGIFSLAERGNCPLMWSHYGDEHRGLCLGYSIPHEEEKRLLRVQYGGGRKVKASEVAAMLRGDATAQQRVDNGVLARKARDWRYEHEWRLIGERGVQDCPLELEEIVFGLRCDEAVRFTVVKAMLERRRSVTFFEIGEDRDSFELDKRELDTEEMLRTFPRRHREIFELFKPVK